MAKWTVFFRSAMPGGGAQKESKVEADELHQNSNTGDYEFWGPTSADMGRPIVAAFPKDVVHHIDQTEP